MKNYNHREARNYLFLKLLLLPIFLLVLTTSVTADVIIGQNDVDSVLVKARASSTASSGTGNFTNFTQLYDTPSTYAGSDDLCLKVDVATGKIKFDTCATGSGDGSYNATYALWAYNQTTPFATWLSNFLYDYNQTTPAITYVDAQDFSSTFNSTYALWSYNQSSPVIDWVNSQSFDSTFNTTYLSTFNSTYELWSYNQTTPAITYVDAQDFSSTFNSTYLSTFNSTYELWSYNQTSPFTDWLGTFLYDYNQTQPAIDWANSQGFDSIFNSTYLSTFNSTYELWSYNQTTPSITYCDNNFLNQDGSNPLTGNWDVGGYNITKVDLVETNKTCYDSTCTSFDNSTGRYFNSGVVGMHWNGTRLILTG